MAKHQTNGDGGGAARAALDVLLTDAAVGNPAAQVLKRPVSAVSVAAKLVRRPDRVARRGAGLALELGRVWAGRSEIAPKRSDRRWADPAWEGNWYLRRVMQQYLALGHTVQGVIDDAELDWQAEQLARFLTTNVHDLLAPTNVPAVNPTVLKQTLDSGGANLVKGVRRMGRDIGARRLPAMVDTTKFDVGGNLASSAGAVVLRTEVFELIQYKPTTAKVRAVPLLFVPPTINRYYVLDLAEKRSLVEYLVGEGQQVFMMSWRNPGSEQGHFDFDTYAAAILEARDAVAKITRQDAVHLNAACAGGLLSTGALAHLADSDRLGDVASLTLMVCALDSARAGTASALTSREVAAAAVAESSRRGYVEGEALANVFAWLRANDLVWGYVVNNYFLGKPPPAFDVLYWNQDAVRLAAGLHRDFVYMALDNGMMKKGKMRVLDSPVDLEKLDVDTYAVAGITDHIVPWANVYNGTRKLAGDVRFVLSTSGHIQALVNPPSKESKSRFRVSSDALPADPATFVRETPESSGSWWPDYSAWLGERSGTQRAARKQLGNARFKPASKAPGSYVHAA